MIKMNSYDSIATKYTPLLLAVLLLGSVTIYVLYYRMLHPLSKYQGPFWASFTNIWKAYHLYNLDLTEKLIGAHEKYGDIVRVGPNDLCVRTESAYRSIYKAGRALPKTKAYNAFTAYTRSLFITQDEDFHATRRRQLAHGFSFKSIKEMEPFINIHVQNLREALDNAADSGSVINLKDLIAYYVTDVLGELAFGQSFETQKTQDPKKMFPINDHVYLGNILSQMPEFLPYLKQISSYMPFPWFRNLIESRKALARAAADCVQAKLNQEKSDRKDLLNFLIDAVDPDTGEKLSDLDLKTEAFSMIVAGSHTTSGTLTLFFAHILQNPSILAKLVSELDEKLPAEVDISYSIGGLEATLVYTTACINENFRMNPVVTMPLPRTVTNPEGITIDGYFIPTGTTVFSSNHITHHNPVIWGPTHDVFDPERFLGPKAEYYKQNLAHFSMGHRMCIGRNMAMTNILKVVSTILKFYTLEKTDPYETISTVSVGIAEKKGPLMVRVAKRSI